MQAAQSFKNIPKESVGQFHFLPWDTLRTPGKRRRRYEDLIKALKLGNDYHTPVKLYFLTEDEQLVCTEATVWMVGDHYISLKGGRTIPIKAIQEVEIY